MTPLKDRYEGFGLVKGVEPVPWGRVRGTFVLPGYTTWVTMAVAGVVFLVVSPLMLLTSERWLADVGVSLISLCVVDLIATTTIVVRRNRRRRKSGH